MESAMQERSLFSATASLLGYMYQCRLALFESLKRLRLNPNIMVTIETLDDVVFEREGTPSEIIQIKHHIKRKANLTNGSVDLWKTIRIWCNLFSEIKVKDDLMLCLMTTESAVDNSAAKYLRIEGRDVPLAEKMLLEVSLTSSNDVNKEGYRVFSSFTPEQRKELLSKVYILDNCPLSKNLDQKITEELWGHCNRCHEKQFLVYLEGWWFARIIKGLDAECFKPITGVEFDSQLAYLREQFKEDGLPIHPEVQSADPDVSPFSDWTFAKQLRIINVGESRINRAVKSFYMASVQRSRWVREDLLIDDELDKYDDILKEEWAIHFEQERDKLQPQANDTEQILSGQNVYNWIEAEADFPIRPLCQIRFITRGSYQILANRLDVGWHPNYISLLRSARKED